MLIAGNPYTDSEDRFTLPDKLVNRTKIYNLGDSIDDTESLFTLCVTEKFRQLELLLATNQQHSNINPLIDRIENNNLETHPTGVIAPGNP